MMLKRVRSKPDFSARLSLWLLSALLVCLWLSGGASRLDVPGQFISRLASFTALIIFTLLATEFHWQRVRPVVLFGGSAFLLIALQLVPLPPGLWSSLPGRDILVESANVAGLPQPWRPLSISPSATLNSLASLVVPLTVIVLAANLRVEDHWRVIALVVACVIAGCILALLQVMRAGIYSPFVNHIAGAVSGNFANRNHFALFVAIGCVLVLCWGFRSARGRKWQSIASVLLLPLFALIILATGSRAGLVLGAVGTMAGALLARPVAAAKMQSLPRRTGRLVVGTIVAAFAATVAISIFLGKAASVNRTLDLEAANDLRTRALPYVWEAIVQYFPFGTGFGTFDPAYRMIEPDALLQPVYFNHAHNDWLEVALEGGLPGVVLVAVGLAWWARKSLAAFRADHRAALISRIGSSVALLIFIASTPDYPARTPLIMALFALSAVWLAMPTTPAPARAANA